MNDDIEVSLSDQLVCVQRELALRYRVYPKWIAAGRMKQEAADKEINAMSAVLRTLKGIAANGK